MDFYGYFSGAYCLNSPCFNFSLSFIFVLFSIPVMSVSVHFSHLVFVTGENDSTSGVSNGVVVRAHDCCLPTPTIDVLAKCAR